MEASVSTMFCMFSWVLGLVIVLHPLRFYLEVLGEPRKSFYS